MYAPRTGSKWSLMNVLMYLWPALLGLCVLFCGQGAAATMHLQSPPPMGPSTRAGAHQPPTHMGINYSTDSKSTPKEEWHQHMMSLSSHPPLSNSNNWPMSHRQRRRRPATKTGSSFPGPGTGDVRHSGILSTFSVSNLDKRPHRQMGDALHRIWTARRRIESIQRRWRRRRQSHKTTNPHPRANPVDVYDTRQDNHQSARLSSSARTKRESRFGRYSTRMFQPISSLSPSSSGAGHMHPKFHPPQPSTPSAMLTSVRQRLGFEAPQPHRALSRTGATTHLSHTPFSSKPNGQLGLLGSSMAPIPAAAGTTVLDSAAPSIAQASHNHTHSHGHRGGLMPMRGRKYCSARDPANLAFEAGVVFEGRVRSMSTHNYSVTFQVLKVHKTQAGFGGQVPSHIRVHFKQVKSLECDLHRENFRNPAHIRGKLDQGKVYFIFGKFVEMNNFTLIGQPMRSTEKHQREVRNGLSETYGQVASIDKLLIKGRASRPIKIICKVNGRPPPTVTWYFKGSQVTRNRIKYKLVHRKRQSQLVIKTYDASDSGLYECRAKNRLTKQSANSTIRLEVSHYLHSATLLPTRNPDLRPSSSNNSGASTSVTDEDEPAVGAEECPPEQKERYCMNGGKCVFFSSVREFSCRCADGFGGERCDMKTPTTYNHSNLRSTTHFALDEELDEEDY